MPELQVALRYVVFAAFAASVLVALASWLVRTRRISPFGALGRTLRAASDPLIRPIEARLVRAGGNPVHAGWWLAVGVAVAGVLLITLWNLLVDTAYSVAAGYSEGPRGRWCSRSSWRTESSSPRSSCGSSRGGSATS